METPAVTCLALCEHETNLEEVQADEKVNETNLPRMDPESHLFSVPTNQLTNHDKPIRSSTWRWKVSIVLAGPRGLGELMEFCLVMILIYFDDLSSYPQHSSTQNVVSRCVGGATMIS